MSKVKGFTIKTIKEAILLDQLGVQTIEISKKLDVPLPLLTKWIRNSKMILEMNPDSDGGSLDEESKSNISKCPPKKVDEPIQVAKIVQPDTSEIKSVKPKPKYNRKAPTKKIESLLDNSQVLPTDAVVKPKRKYTRKTPGQTIPVNLPTDRVESVLSMSQISDLPLSLSGVPSSIEQIETCDIPVIRKPKRQTKAKPKTPEVCGELKTISENVETTDPLCDIPENVKLPAPKKQTKRTKKQISQVSDPAISTECNVIPQAVPEPTAIKKSKRIYIRKPTVQNVEIKSVSTITKPFRISDLSDLSSIRSSISDTKIPGDLKEAMKEVLEIPSPILTDCELKKLTNDLLISDDSDEELSDKEEQPKHIKPVQGKRITKGKTKDNIEVTDTTKPKRKYTRKPNTPSIEITCLPTSKDDIPIKDSIGHETDKETNQGTIELKKSLENMVKSPTPILTSQELKNIKDPSVFDDTSSESECTTVEKIKLPEFDEVRHLHNKMIARKNKIPTFKRPSSAKRLIGPQVGSSMPSNYVIKDWKKKERDIIEFHDKTLDTTQQYPVPPPSSLVKSIIDPESETAAKCQQKAIRKGLLSHEEINRRRIIFENILAEIKSSDQEICDIERSSRKTYKNVVGMDTTKTIGVDRFRNMDMGYTDDEDSEFGDLCKRPTNDNEELKYNASETCETDMNAQMYTEMYEEALKELNMSDDETEDKKKCLYDIDNKIIEPEITEPVFTGHDKTQEDFVNLKESNCDIDDDLGDLESGAVNLCQLETNLPSTECDEERYKPIMENDASHLLKDLEITESDSDTSCENMSDKDINLSQVETNLPLTKCDEDHYKPIRESELSQLANDLELTESESDTALENVPNKNINLSQLETDLPLTECNEDRYKPIRESDLSQLAKDLEITDSESDTTSETVTTDEDIKSCEEEKSPLNESKKNDSRNDISDDSSPESLNSESSSNPTSHSNEQEKDEDGYVKRIAHEIQTTKPKQKDINLDSSLSSMEQFDDNW